MRYSRSGPEQPQWGMEEVSNSYVPRPPDIQGAPRQRRGMSPGQLVLVIGLCVVALCAGAVALVGVFVSPAPEPEPWRVEAATNPASGGPKASVPGNSPKLVVEITGTGPATISWQLNGTGGQDTEAALPWKREFGPFEGFAVWSFVAQTKNGTTSAAVRIQMSYGDKVYGPCEAQGPYSVATCTTNS